VNRHVADLFLLVFVLAVFGVHTLTLGPFPLPPKSRLIFFPLPFDTSFLFDSDCFLGAPYTPHHIQNSAFLSFFSSLIPVNVFTSACDFLDFPFLSSCELHTSASLSSHFGREGRSVVSGGPLVTSDALLLQASRQRTPPSPLSLPRDGSMPLGDPVDL